MTDLHKRSAAEKQAAIDDIEGFSFTLTLVGAELSAVYAALLTMRTMALNAKRDGDPEFKMLTRALRKVEFILQMGAQPAAGST